MGWKGKGWDLAERLRSGRFSDTERRCAEREDGAWAPEES